MGRRSDRRRTQECRIDAIAQSWAVLAGGGDPARARQAMESAERHLVRRDDRIVLLLTPPFDKMTPSPGYIQGYVPGVRENGGQYTHAALWTVLAFARLGDGDRATELFSMLNPLIAHAQRARRSRAIAPNRTSWRPTSTHSRRTPDAAAGRGTRDRPAWMYRVGIEAILGLTMVARALRVDPCIPKEWPASRNGFRRPRCDYRIRSRIPIVSATAWCASSWMARRIAERARLPIREDGRSHVVRVVLGARSVTS